ncbi:12488_t:CDS:2 [Acaulospora morrowiae]|uniref:12488_t:CDS:1 n=1 Tax=Acaulospora morrowiae TaxID=94023 RepID=A0A9N9C2R8_9GLOM|nr:12488_t:CDS:2 [Acaulospora morrowiae]
MSSLSLLFVPRNRKVEFEVEIIIHELTDVPLVTGLYYVKWKLRNSERPQGMTERVIIKDHRVFWNYRLHNTTQLVIGKDGFLMPCELRLTIKQELSGGREINNIGKLSLNISEYVGLNATNRKYLLQDSKINSTLKLTVNMKQTFGDVVFKVPALKRTQIFGGLTGIILEQTERQDDERSSLGLRPDFGHHYKAFSRSTTSLKSAYYAQSTHITPITSSLVANSFLQKVGEKSATDVVEEIFMGTLIMHEDDDYEGSFIHSDSD